MEIQGKDMRPIPKNVRQIGERDDEIKLYVEDYVNTFIRKCARTGTTVVGALIGEYYAFEGKEYLFVEGAVLADGIQEADGKLVMTDEAWSSLYGKISEFFCGKAVCGWFICSGETSPCNVCLLRGFMYDNLGAGKRALIVHNAEADEEIFSVYDRTVIREQQGYYLFYERNEPMQSYMVTTVFATRTDPVAVDAVTTHVRTRVVEKKEIPVQRSGAPFISAAALVLGVIALASGIVMMNHYEQLKEMEAVLTGLVGNQLEIQTDPSEETEEETEPKFGGLIIEDVSGDVLPEKTEISTEMTGESETETESSETGNNETKDDETGNSESETGETEEVSASGEEAQDQQVNASGKDEPVYQTYLVQKGDTLVTISWQLYGRRDDEVIDLICELNHLEDKDHIYAGQELLIP